MMSVEPIVYSVAEAARAMSATEAAVRNLIAGGRLKVERVGGRVYVQEHDHCGDLDSAVEGDRVWMTCTCGAAINRPADDD
jgi:hypothetical protein